MTEENPQPLPHTQPEIKGLARGACVLVSLGGFVAGVCATFKTDNEVGTSALLLVGVLAGIVAILQRIPKIKMGDNEIDPGPWVARGIAIGADAVADAVEEALEESEDPKELARVARDTGAVLDSNVARWFLESQTKQAPTDMLQWLIDKNARKAAKGRHSWTVRHPECGHLIWPRLGRGSSRILAPPGW
jgi:hypothetical protein